MLVGISIQVTQGVDQIASMVQTTSATAKESASASEQMMIQSLYLKGAVEYFRLKEE